MSRTPLNIGLFGFGCVGKGLYDVLNSTKQFKAQIAGICVKHKDKERSLPAHYFTFDKYALLDNPDINLIVELIDDADAAFEIVSYALRKGKAVVSANKKMIAEHFDELLALQQQYQVPFLYEAAACASIPVIRNLEEYYNNDLLTSFEGIINGSTNYILSKMYEQGLDYHDVLAEAQRLGFAESNPALDVEGYDAQNKLCILAAHAFGTLVAPDRIFRYGIQHISSEDIRYAKEKGWKIKLVANARKIGNDIALWVAPKFVPAGHSLYYIDNEYNAVQVEGVFSDKQFFSGKGAGSYPTASAVLSDISALTYGYRYEYKKLLAGQELGCESGVAVQLYCRYPDSITLSGLPFRSISQSFRSRNFNYVIGEAELEAVWQSGLLDKEDVFIAQIGEELSLAKTEVIAQELAEII